MLSFSSGLFIKEAVDVVFLHEMLLKVPAPLVWSLMPYGSMKGLFCQMTYLQSQWMDFKNLNEFWS